MQARERNGVRVGQPVRDLDGLSLGRVRRLFDWGFSASRSVLVFRRDNIIRYDEVRAVRDGTLVVARSRHDLFDLAAGGVPASWKIPAPAAFPTTATPSEARDLMEDVAAGRVPGDSGAEGAERSAAAGPRRDEAPAASAALGEADVRAYVASRGQSGARQQQADARGTGRDRR